MTLLAVGASHRTCPLELLERLAGVATDPGTLAAAVLQSRHVREAVVLATCNRVELYLDATRFHDGLDVAAAALAERAGIDLVELAEHMYAHYDGAAFEHLLTVTAGLDSLAVGEGQIIGQVREAWNAAHRAGHAGAVLAPVFSEALRAGRRVRAESGLDRHNARLVDAALARAVAVADGQRVPRASHLVVVGAGTMASLVVSRAAHYGIERLDVVNRGAARGARLAEAAGGRALGFADLPQLLVEADLVVTTTGSTGHVVTEATVAGAAAGRGGRPLAIVDLALPRDVDPAVAGLPGVALDDLATLGRVLRTEAAGHEVDDARELLAEEVAAWHTAQRADAVKGTVVALRAHGDHVVEDELARLRRRLRQLDEVAVAEIERTLNRVVHKVLHEPTVRVQRLAGEPGGSVYAEALQTLFGLKVSDRVEPVGLLGPRREGEPT